MRVAVDAMGGDYAPAEVVAGCLQAVSELPAIERLYLVGDRDRIQPLFQQGGVRSERIEVRHAGQVVEMDEAPAAALRRKKDSSIARAVDLVKAGEADAVFSAGNTGAAVAATTLKLRPLKAISRPAIATIMPTPSGRPFVLVDAGANTDCSAEQLYEFAVMGMVYSREILGVPCPSVGLLSIGEEAAKGNVSTKETYRRLRSSSLEFSGNVESSDLFEGRVDVVVCDGFVGNVVLKTSEAVAHAVSEWLHQEMTRNPLRILGAMLSRGAFKSMRRRADPAVYGGAPLLGLNGVCIIGHGSSRAQAVCNALRVAGQEIKSNINKRIERELQQGSDHEES